MRGNVCIELHNHKTGLRDRIEGHNDVTEALQTMINAFLCTNQNIDSYRPIVKSLLGGVILMDTELSGTDIFIPGNANVIGSGFQGSETTSKIVGTYNSAESGIDETQRIYTHVWDFATSQANGTIKSLGLTTSQGGRYPNTPTTMFSNTFSDGWIIYNDEANNDIYYVKSQSSSNEAIYKAHYSYTDLMIHNIRDKFDGVNTGKTINASIMRDGRDCIDGMDGNIYIPYSETSTQVKFAVYKVSDLSFEAQSDLVIDLSAHDIVLHDTGGRPTINAAMGYVYILNKFDPNKYYIYRYDINSDKLDIYDISDAGYLTRANYFYITTTPSGDAYCVVNSNGLRINADWVASDFENFRNAGISYPGKGVARLNGMCTETGRYYILANLLMTNFNLPTPIEKTSAQSMKVIYTLTQE